MHPHHTTHYHYYIQHHEIYSQTDNNTHIPMQNENTHPKITTSSKIISIDIDGVIGVSEEAQFEEGSHSVATYEKFEQALAEIGEGGPDKVVINIRSMGGDLGDALLIHDAAVGLGVEVVTRCYGYVASAATVIAQSASKGCREISANAFYLIHCCESSVEGNSQSFTLTKQLLEKSDQRLAEIYAEASGRTPEEFLRLMNENAGKGRWLTPDEALRYGLVDRIIPSSPITASAADTLAVLGLPPLPQQKRKGAWWNSLMEKVGIHRTTPEVVQSNVELSVADLTSKRTSTSATTPASRLHTAEPTRTKECEDPAFREAPVAGTANQNAYENDARTLREAIARENS